MKPRNVLLILLLMMSPTIHAQDRLASTASTTVKLQAVQLEAIPVSDSLLSDSLPNSAPADSNRFVRHAVEPFEKLSPPNFAPAKDNGKGFHWKQALEQSLLLLAIQHGYAMSQPKTREALRGPFFKDYFESVKSLHGWDDGGRFFTNYLAHPMQGALTGFIQIQNDPRGFEQQFGLSKSYWASRARAFLWTAAMSTQFEIGPLSQAAIGNVGKHGKQTYVDLVITPTAGTLWLVTEDALDRFVIRRVINRTDNFYLKIMVQMLFNPIRSTANLFRFKKPWSRDY
jgi:hypothetical protein